MLGKLRKTGPFEWTVGVTELCLSIEASTNMNRPIPLGVGLEEEAEDTRGR